MRRFADDYDIVQTPIRLWKMGNLMSQFSTLRLCDKSVWRPSFDVYELNDEIMVVVELAGVQPEDINVVVDRKGVYINGNRCRPTEQSLTRIHNMEVDFGPFRQVVQLPVPVDPKKADSSYQNGFLLIRLRKKARMSKRVSGGEEKNVNES
jgi:HSP20 family protein